MRRPPPSPCSARPTTKTMTCEPTAHTSRPTAKNTSPASRTTRGPFQSARAPATTVALSCVASAAPDAIGYQGAALKDSTTTGMIVVAASSSKATRVMRSTDPMAKPISDGAHEARAGEEESAAGMLTILLTAHATLRTSGVQ